MTETEEKTKAEQQTTAEEKAEHASVEQPDGGNGEQAE